MEENLKQAGLESFTEKIQLALDPYFDREFFTNLIHVLDRGMSLGEVFEATLEDLSLAPARSLETDRSILQLFYAFQASSSLRQSYQSLPLFQSLYSLALFRSDGRRPIERVATEEESAMATTLEDFQRLIRPGSRRVEPVDRAWSYFLFLMDNRSMRAGCIELIIDECFRSCDELSSSLLLKAFDLAFSRGWTKNELILRRAFESFWLSARKKLQSEKMNKAESLLAAQSLEAKHSGGVNWKADWIEELWHRIQKETAESAWEWMLQLGREGVSRDQLLCSLQILRGRMLGGMRHEQWGNVTKSVRYAASLESAARWVPRSKDLYIAASLVDLVSCLRLVGFEAQERASGDELLSGLSINLSKNQLILRMDDACEKGDRRHAEQLLSLVVKDRGLTHSVSDRLLLMACKQDAWTYDQSTLLTAYCLTSAYQQGVRVGLPSEMASDAVFGLLRYLSDQRDRVLDEVKRQGHYGDHLKRSTFDVSGGARIVERFVFNQVRNAQRIQTWPSEGKG